MNQETKTAVSPILEQDMALGAYLDALLCPQPMATPAPEAVPAPAVDPIAAAIPEQAPEPVPVMQPEPVREEVVAVPVLEPEPAPAPAVEEKPASLVPAWAEDSFQCLLFKVGGLSLAVPLERLNGVAPWQGDGVTPMPGHSAWFLGLHTRQDQQVKVVDTALLVVPPDRRQALTPGDPERLGHVIFIDEGRWGLACDCLGEVVTLAPHEVKWRSSEGKRPWLAGTVIEHMCALLDTEAFAGLLRDGEG